MTRRPNPPLPARPVALLLVEGGDERALCEAIVGPTRRSDFACWVASGRADLPNIAALARLDPSFPSVRSVGVILDVEEDLPAAMELAARTVAALGAAVTPPHGSISAGTPAVGIFLLPDGTSPGCTETVCRAAARDTKLAACVDAMVACAGAPQTTASRAAKGWLHAYLSMLPDPVLRFHQALSPSGPIDVSHAVFNPLRSFLLAL